MSSKGLVPGIPLLRFSGRILDVQNLHFNVHIAQTGEAVEVFCPILNIQSLGGPIEVASDNHFACLDETHLDWTIFLVRQLGQFQRILNGGWWIVVDKDFHSGGLPVGNEEFVYVDFAFIGAD